MRTTLRKIGNSQGILIPAPLLAECGITNEINLHLEGTKIVIESAKPARAGWFDSYRAEIELDGKSARILLDQIRSVDKIRLLGKLGEIDETLWHGVMLQMLG